MINVFEIILNMEELKFKDPTNIKCQSILWQINNVRTMILLIITVMKEMLNSFKWEQRVFTMD